jgi:hypothetical protein
MWLICSGEHIAVRIDVACNKKQSNNQQAQHLSQCCMSEQTQEISDRKQTVR